VALGPVKGRSLGVTETRLRIAHVITLRVSHYHPAFFQKYHVTIPAKSDDGAIARTLAFFARQRPELFSAQMRPAFADYLRRNLELRIPCVTSFEGRVGLDAGCGEGRYAQCMTSYGADVVGMDLGNSVDYAYRRNRDNPRVDIVQGSILQPPFKDGVFDFVTSIGVLHHLPDPQRGFESLVPLLHVGGTIHIWVYGLEGMSLVYRLSHLSRYGEVLGVLLLDIDNFAAINELYGNAAGDRVLQHVAVSLNQGIRESDTVARPGGDEFMIVLPRVGSSQNATAVAAKIREFVTPGDIVAMDDWLPACSEDRVRCRRMNAVRMSKAATLRWYLSMTDIEDALSHQ
jgi:GGDEF domain-containing protein